MANISGNLSRWPTRPLSKNARATTNRPSILRLSYTDAMRPTPALGGNGERRIKSARTK